MKHIVRHKVVTHGQMDGMYDLTGKRISLPKGTKETLTTEETTIDCSRCSIQTVIKTTGMGFAAYNEAVRQTNSFLKDNCGKWQDRLASGSVKGEMPDSLLPK